MKESRETFKFHEFEIPVDLLNLTGGGVETFDIISAHHLALLHRFVDINTNDRVLEIGCGIGRDAIPLTKILSQNAKYFGIDIIRPSIEFCVSQISSRYKNFKFIHFDVEDQLHNPSGVRQMIDVALPIADQSIDKVFGWSVFTHMWERDIRHYLKEFYRVLRPGGKALLTCFVLTPEILAHVSKADFTRSDLRFDHQINDHCWVNELEFPLGAIGYSPESLRSMVKDSGLVMQRDFIRGGWSGFYSDSEDGQDGLLLIRP